MPARFTEFQFQAWTAKAHLQQKRGPFPRSWRPSVAAACTGSRIPLPEPDGARAPGRAQSLSVAFIPVTEGPSRGLSPEGRAQTVTLWLVGARTDP